MFRLNFASIIVTAATSLNGCLSLSSSASVSRDFTVNKDVVYTPGNWPARLVADIYKPVSGKPTPAVLLIHGGGWNKEERRSDMTGIARDLAQRGYFVMNATYRLTPKWKYPAPVNDLHEAIRYMRRNSATLNIDSARVATFGYSAGGHLSALVGLHPVSAETEVQAIIAGGAPADLSLWPDGKLVKLFVGGPFQEIPATYREASPVTYVNKNSPPVFIYHGTDDDLVPVAHPKVFIAALEKQGVDHQVYWVEGRSHILTHLFSAKAIPKAIDFLDRKLDHNPESSP
ncbi:MAG: alpha/beta hydrolase [Gloeobacteraceae cyanobacterium ES-bin-144]|nr:alpha/beta hydrolase [Verrucomicrobiales bacterium]